MVMEKIMLKINGLHDESIAYECEAAILRLDGVGNAEIDTGTEIAIIEIDPEKVSKKDIQQAVNEIGFSVSFQ